jgi:hypothetical protein
LRVREVGDEGELAEAVATGVPPAQIDNRRRHGWLALTLAWMVALSLFAAACGGSTGKGVAHVDSGRTTTSASDSSGSASSSGRRGALVAFAACMRKHGLPNFPDPKAVGRGYRLTIGSENGIDTNSPQFKNALQACKKVLPNGGTASPQDQAKHLQEALKYAVCIRAHGVPDFPDPKPSGNGGIELGETPSSPQFKTAQKACRQLLPGAGGGPP